LSDGGEGGGGKRAVRERVKGFWYLDKGLVRPLTDFHNLKTGPAIGRKTKGSEKEFMFINRSPYPKKFIIYIKKFLKKKLIIVKSISILVPCKEYQSKPLPGVSNLAKQSL
jgi:hypothetical protein